MLDGLYYLPEPKESDMSKLSANSCENFRAGDKLSKAQKGVKVNGIFAAVCVHGFIYKMIGNNHISYII